MTTKELSFGIIDVNRLSINISGYSISVAIERKRNIYESSKH